MKHQLLHDNYGPLTVRDGFINAVFSERWNEKKLKWKSFQRSSFMGMNDFRREDEMQKRLDEREQMEEEEEEEMKEENMDTKEEEETVINNHNDNNNSNHTDEKVR